MHAARRCSRVRGTTTRLTVSGDTYRVRLNGHLTSTYTNPDATRGVSADVDPTSGFIGLQQHTGAASFRAVRIKPGPVGP